MMLMNKTALITGGSSGIGLATAKLFLENGARVAITGRDAASLKEARDALDGDVLTLEADVRSSEDLQRMAATVREHFDGLDILFANAGVAFVTPLGKTTEEQFDKLMDINVKGTFFTIQAVEPIMREGGSIILNTAWLNQVGAPGRGALSASKAAVRSLARTLSAELLPRRIRVNAVSPGLIETPILRGVGQSEHPGQSDAEFKAYIQGAVDMIPIGRLGNAEEIAGAVLFLAGDGSSYMLGSELVVDGGFGQL
ncbi:SDR family oxidoreductase [Paraburkholderia sp. BL6669N2]|uniref:SDR family oxidoreductase n=1 Tax=Paraburkholderia sp. BL6669N2 TaxID=1938807 RepID=UPI001C6EB6EB|nr:SDR family oxidoreductase [Paraburkholderia sp. BL6669N2]